MSDSWELLDDNSRRCAFCGEPLADRVAGVRSSGAGPCSRCGHTVWFAWVRSDDVLEIRLLASKNLSPALAGPLDSQENSRGARRIVIDLKVVRTLPSTYLGKMQRLVRERASRGPVTIRNVHPDLREVFRITRLDHIVNIE
jgi:hypothetical protein